MSIQEEHAQTKDTDVIMSRDSISREGMDYEFT
jgi:hypothetical protein